MPRRLLLATVSGLVLSALTACGGVSATPAQPGAGATPTAASSGSGTGCAYPAAGEAAKPVKPPAATGMPRRGTATAVLRMSAGDVTITMNQAATPCTVNSFRSLAAQGYFNSTSCHRLTTSGIFVLQCGDPTGTGSGGPGYAFGNETTGKESYTRGVVAMANAGPNTNGSQFFLVYADSTTLDQTPDYTIFGRMDAASVDVVARIAAGGQDGSNGPGDGKPKTPADILSVTSR